MKAKQTTTKKLTLDPKNANKHSKFGQGLLENSIRETGFGRSILISADDVVIAGNGTVQGAEAVGMQKVKVIETDGTEIIAVKRTDVKSGTPEFYKMALADNIVAQENIVLDIETVEAIVEQYPDTKVWGAMVTDPPGSKDKIEDPDKANQTTVTFHLSRDQAAQVKKALSMSKELNKTKFKNAGNINENANALFFMAQEYLKAHNGKSAKKSGK